MKRLSFKDNLLDIIIVIAVIVATIALIIMPFIKLNIDKSKYPELEGHEQEIIDGMLGYPGYYVVAEAEINGLMHDIGSTDVDGKAVLMLPEGTDNNLVLTFHTIWDAEIGKYRCDFDKQDEYVVDDKPICIVKSEKPFMFIDIDTGILNEIKSSYRPDNPEKKKAHADVTVYNRGELLQHMDSIISPRGAATWNLYDKKPFSLKLAKDSNIFHFGPIKKYNLLANASDKTLLRNEVFFDLCNELGLANTPKITNVNMYFNTEYQGVYSVSTKVKVGKNTLDLNIGDFLVCWGAPNYKNPIFYDCDFWTDDVDRIDTGDGTTSSAYVDLEWPEKEHVSATYKKQVQYIIQNYVNIIEGKSEGKISDYMDIDSLAKYYWIQEIGMNVDAWYRSTYMYYTAKDGMLHMGPMWDMEFVIGANTSKNNIDFRTPEGWKIRNNAYYIPLFQNEEFVEAVNRIYEEYDLKNLMYESLENFKRKTKEHELEGQLNYRMWVDEVNYFDADTPIMYPNYDEYCQAKYDFYKQRIDWIVREME